ncbi:MFS transporter [Alkalihalobacillus sp. TS-13]|uniref:MFS transporter n=1 Tax=Alkalihalobacillus sp. TS-13 TaxID=2842455 RepID=UPI001C88896C|nr:MFS transporter [Alkalihalobacillus sp. TS-13]
MRKIVLPGIAMIGVTYSFARFSFGLFLPNISASLSLTESNAGIVGSTAYISYTLALFTSAFLIQKFGQLRMIQLSGISAFIGLLGIAISQEFSLLALSSFIAGIGSGWASPAYSQVASTALQTKDKDQGNTWINSGTSFGIMLSGPVALLFTEYWRFAYVLFAIIALVVLVWNNLSIPSQDMRSNITRTKLQWLPAIKKARFLLVASLIIGGISSIFWTFSRSYLTVVYDMNMNESVLFWILMGISGVVGGIAGGLINRAGLALSYRLILIMMLLSLFFITIPTTITVYFSSVFFGISYIFLTGLFIVWSTRIFKSNPSIGVSLSFLSLGVGQSFGSAIAGGMIDMTSYTLSFMLFSFIGIFGLFVPINNRFNRVKVESN